MSEIDLIDCCKTCFHSSTYNGEICCTFGFEINEDILPTDACENWEPVDD